MILLFMIVCFNVFCCGGNHGEFSNLEKNKFLY